MVSGVLEPVDVDWASRGPAIAHHFEYQCGRLTVVRIQLVLMPGPGATSVSGELLNSNDYKPYVRHTTRLLVSRDTFRASIEAPIEARKRDFK